ncbi:MULTISPECIES: hypothetical protein [Bacillus cereus group]|uniref:Uncharacterized protein n=3 Tax=Bacillus thuringiensis TaxID=1428 RepID=A0AAP4V693_BACTU|nr:MULTISPECIES: hypothetical protein [Bacillus cereus group]MEC2878707.1 hypothetical protein [Bacillus cereus]AGG05627.1 hypothetical protein H175_328p296 [Bacillus thuringiensis serovar thuringiensis str. IS5056]ARP61184.1 hypothetical protein CAB88_29580 [Bacillus thuringiensis]EEM31426.1 hypothetical protein bthur0003_61080 [Bacillus thuringiensis serovar thuringiensis str. T01001]EEM62860.1 hypothetical protein bthur0008_55480 [Bacillus thuringiensis serovar berliner ATCC 10792]
MEPIIVKLSTEFNTTAKDLKDKFSEYQENHQTETTFHNSEAPLVWIIRGCIDYFDQLDNGFLGIGNESGIPSVQADHFANNLYRLNNAMKYLKRLWDLKEYKTLDEFNTLLDIRTLIVHSGEQLTKIESLKLEGYKDIQLWRIFGNKENDSFTQLSYFNNASLVEMDYCLEIASDKQDKTKKGNLSKVDHHIQNESFLDQRIYLKAEQVRNIVMAQIEYFITSADQVKTVKSTRNFPPIEVIIDKENNKINFDKIAELVSKDLRGGYIIERGIEHWNGFGLKRLMEYTKNSSDISSKAQDLIYKRIINVMTDYWENFSDVNIPGEKLSDLDIMQIFSDYTPNFDEKNYLECEKLFTNIAPYFNTKDRNDSTDIGYLAIFIDEISRALNMKFNLDQNVDEFVCDYIVQSIKKAV